MTNDSVNIKNKKATFNYELIDKYEAGIKLLGTEIKSIRNGKASIAEAYCTFIKDELYILNMHITEYNHGGFVNHEPTRKRKLLLHRQELEKLQKKLTNQGLTVIPVRLYINKNGFAKLQIALAKGKKLYDKREDLKAKDAKRAIDRVKI